MENLIQDVPGHRRLFSSVDEFSTHGSPIIPCNPRKRGLRWLIVTAVLVSLWGIAMAGQLATESLLHQGAPVVGQIEANSPGR
jgi:hypothetical protein